MFVLILELVFRNNNILHIAGNFCQEKFCLLVQQEITFCQPVIEATSEVQVIVPTLLFCCFLCSIHTKKFKENASQAYPTLEA